MYIPELFKLTDRSAVEDLIRRNNFGLLITASGGAPTATHLPFLFDAARGPHGTILGHMAKANPQWRDFESLDGEALVVFQGSHAYISPTWYGGERPSVPTWNYSAVHAYGSPRLDEDPDALRHHLERMVEAHEADLDPPWRLEDQDAAFLTGMMRGIVAFEIPITRIEAKAKLNQNKRAAERLGAADALAAQDDPMAQALARQMRALGS